MRATDFQNGIESRETLAGGCVGEVERWHLVDGTTVVAKIDRKESGSLLGEARMLDRLDPLAFFPSPRVLAAEPGLLVMTDLGGRPGPHGEVEIEVARRLAALHEVGAEAFGFAEDTWIAALPQPNTWQESWPRFYAEQRLQPMAEAVTQSGLLPTDLRNELDHLSSRIENELPTGTTPALLHGDLWSGNLLSEGKRLCGFIDPALYFGDPEIELAFIDLFQTFSPRFFATYDHLRKPTPGDRRRRFQVLQLYPLLVHLRLFGSSYLPSIERILRGLRA